MITILKYVELIVATIMIVLISWQGGRADGLTSAITGVNNLSLFATSKSRGTDKLFDRGTLILAVLFLGIATVIGLVG